VIGWKRSLVPRRTLMETGHGGKFVIPSHGTELMNRGIEQTTILASKLKELGVDMLDVSSGGNDLRGKIKVGPSYRKSTLSLPGVSLIQQRSNSPSTSKRLSQTS
jgi:hypothetical protein